MAAIELLSPAGDFEKMKYALAYGADAVYLGIPRFSLRARENKFRSLESVFEAVRYAHNLNKKVYLTANVFPHNRKVQPFFDFIDELLQQCQPDAWIVSDPGIILYFKEKHPEQILHLSVQANVVNFAAAQFWQKLGIQRLILSRELSIEEIKTIAENCPALELEVFVHGAICIAYSGRCLISNYLASRDPNQGTCSNSCRWRYKLYQKTPIQPFGLVDSAPDAERALTQSGESYAYLHGDFYLEEAERREAQFMQIDEDENGSYLMNSRDLCAIEYLAELREAGVSSFKIEGRTKSVYYVSLITRAYRRAIDNLAAGKSFDPELWVDIFATANKGFTAGFLKNHPGFSAQKYDSTLAESQQFRFCGIVRGYDDIKKMIRVEAKNKILAGTKLQIVSPGETTDLTVENLYDDFFRKVNSISGGSGSIWLPCPEKPADFSLLRAPI